MDKDKKVSEEVEDVTVYGEMVSSLHQWMTMDKQRKRAREHEKLSDGKNKNSPKYSK